MISSFKPYDSRVKHNISFFNEMFILMTLYTFMCFSDLVPDAEMRYNVGFACFALVSFYLIINVMLIV